jgi:predicted transposase/invertase (TIGR01784 family)
LFTRPDVAREFLAHYLPAHLVAALDLATLELVEGSFVDAELRQHLSDLIFRERLRSGGQTFIYILFEHKSEADRWVAWQVLRYLMRLWEEEQAQGVEKLTPILPIVFYHGRRRWRFGTNFGELIEFAGFEELREYVPEFRCYLYDLTQYGDAQLVGSPLLRFGLLLMKYIFRQRELAARLEEFLTVYRPLYSGSRWDFLFVGLKYLASVVPRLPRERLQAAVATVFRPEEGVIMQTIAETWVEEGKQLGLQQGHQQGRQEEAAAFALRLLHKHLGPLDAATQQYIEALGVAQLEELGLAASDFRTPQDLSAWLQTHTKPGPA